MSLVDQVLVFCVTSRREIDCRDARGIVKVQMQNGDGMISARLGSFIDVSLRCIYQSAFRSGHVRLRYCFYRTPERVEVKLTAGLSRLLLLVF